MTVPSSHAFSATFFLCLFFGCTLSWRFLWRSSVQFSLKIVSAVFSEDRQCSFPWRSSVQFSLKIVSAVFPPITLFYFLCTKIQWKSSHHHFPIRLTSIWLIDWLIRAPLHRQNCLRLRPQRCILRKGNQVRITDRRTNGISHGWGT